MKKLSQASRLMVPICLLCAGVLSSCLYFGPSSGSGCPKDESWALLPSRILHNVYTGPPDSNATVTVTVLTDGRVDLQYEPWRRFCAVLTEDEVAVVRSVTEALPAGRLTFSGNAGCEGSRGSSAISIRTNGDEGIALTCGELGPPEVRVFFTVLHRTLYRPFGERLVRGLEWTVPELAEEVRGGNEI